MDKKYKIKKQLDSWRKEPLCYEVYIKKRFLFFNYWEPLTDDCGFILLFDTVDMAKRYAEEFVNGREVII